MTKSELEVYLEKRGVPKQLYSLDGMKKCFECYCVVKDGEKYKIIYSERGNSSVIHDNLSEEQAYDLLLEDFKRAYKWD